MRPVQQASASSSPSGATASTAGLASTRARSSSSSAAFAGTRSSARSGPAAEARALRPGSAASRNSSGGSARPASASRASKQPERRARSGRQRRLGAAARAGRGAAQLAEGAQQGARQARRVLDRPQPGQLAAAEVDRAGGQRLERQAGDRRQAAAGQRRGGDLGRRLRQGGPRHPEKTVAAGRHHRVAQEVVGRAAGRRQHQRPRRGVPFEKGRSRLPAFCRVGCQQQKLVGISGHRRRGDYIAQARGGPASSYLSGAVPRAPHHERASPPPPHPEFAAPAARPRSALCWPWPAGPASPRPRRLPRRRPTAPPRSPSGSGTKASRSKPGDPVFAYGQDVPIASGDHVHIYVQAIGQGAKPLGTSAIIGYPGEFGYGGTALEVLKRVRMEAQNPADRQYGRMRFTAAQEGGSSLGYRLEAVDSPAGSRASPPAAGSARST